MIVKMKKTTLICLLSQQEKTLEELQNLGVMHVKIETKTDSEECLQLQQMHDQLERAVGFLASIKLDKHHKPEDIEIPSSGQVLAENVLDLINTVNTIGKKRENLRRDLDRFLPWGNFSQELVAEIQQKGIYVYLCAGAESDFAKLPEFCTHKIISEEKGKLYYAVISQQPIDATQLNLANLPEDQSLDGIRKQISDCETELEDANKKLETYSLHIDLMHDYFNVVKEQLDFITNRDGMGKEGELTYLKGFVPEPRVEELTTEAKKHGWALLITDPAENETVPTLLQVPKIFNIAKPIFDFIGIMPAYQEWDVSVMFLFFFTIFFGMIVGDAGYGLIFLGLGITLKCIFKDPKLKLPINLFIVLSIATTVWGALTCTYFGIPVELFPEWMKQVKAISTSDFKNQNVQWLCFLLAAIHLSSARSWKAILALSCKKLQGLGEIGWAMLIWGNFFTAVELIVFKGSFPQFAYYLYVIGFLLIAVFGINWKDIGDIFNFPFGLIGSFVDVLSYIRLFAVGLSTYYIANSFNQMGTMVLKISPILIIGTIIIILFGHLLNIALAMMGVLVHGIRLNTLEFSNHMGLTWSGIFFKPFRKLSNNKNNNIENKEN